MKVFAVIKNGIVINIIMWDGEDKDFAKEIDGDLVASTEEQQPGIGWLYDGERFITPPHPEKTQHQIIELATLEKEGRIRFANDYMNNKQWPGKAAIGRLKGDDLIKYNLWLDYLDLVDAVDVQSAPEITWPNTPS
ncbi:tail fiber assembly protein [Lelliottia amnigena]|jgi:hypothetical protein